MPVCGIPLYVGIPIPIYKSEANLKCTWASNVHILKKVEFERNMLALTNFVYISGKKTGAVPNLERFSFHFKNKRLNVSTLRGFVSKACV